MSGKVLVIDDSSVNRHLLGQLLRAIGAEVTEAAAGPAGLELVGQETFDLILLDMRMPEMDGFAVLSFLKSQPEMSHIPVMMISGLEDAEAVVRCLEVGAEDYVTKPYEPAVMKARIRASLERKQLRDRERHQVREVTALRNELNQVREELSAANKKAVLNAFKDVLTELPSKRAGSDSLRRMVAEAERYKTPLTALLLEVDQHSQWAARLGLPAGEKILRLAAETLAANVRACDLVCRFGSADFLVACPQISASQAQVLVERLATLLPEVWSKEFQQDIRFSAGIAQHTGQLGDLLQGLDQALATAKHRGSGHWEIHKPGEQAPVIPKFSFCVS